MSPQSLAQRTILESKAAFTNPQEMRQAISTIDAFAAKQKPDPLPRQTAVAKAQNTLRENRRVQRKLIPRPIPPMASRKLMVFFNGRLVSDSSKSAELIRNYLQVAKQLPIRPSVPDNAKDLLSQFSENPKNIYQAFLEILGSVTAQCLSLETKGSTTIAAWMVKPEYLREVSAFIVFGTTAAAGRVRFALQRLKFALLNGDFDIVKNTMALAVGLGNFSEEDSAELLRGYWQLIVDNRNRLNESGRTGSGSLPVLGVATEYYTGNSLFSPFVRALALDPTVEGVPALLNFIADFMADRDPGGDVFSAEPVGSLFGYILYSLNGGVLSIPGDWNSNIARMLYCYVTLNGAVKIMYRRLGFHAYDLTDNIASVFLRRVFLNNSGGAYKSLGGWTDGELRAMLAAQLTTGTVGSDEQMDFLHLLLAAEFDFLDGKYSLTKIIPQLILIDDGVDTTSQAALTNFLANSCDTNTLAGSIAVLNPNSLNAFITLFTNELAHESLIHGLIRDCNPANVRLLNNSTEETAKKNAARGARDSLARVLKSIDDLKGDRDDNIVMAVVANLPVDQLMWISKLGLQQIIHILEEGDTNAEEHTAMENCRQAIGRIEGGLGAGSF